MGKKNILYVEIVCHVLFWIIPTYLSIKYELVSYGVSLGQQGERYAFIAGAIINILTVYFNIFILFPAYNRKRLNTPIYLLLLLFIVIIVSLVTIKIFNLFDQYYGIHRTITFVPFLVTEIINTAFFAIQSTLYCIVKEWIKNKIIKSKLVEEKLLLELKYLKAQINPHFLFNTLNNLYSIALKNKDDETATGITKLSYIMRFMIDDVNKDIIALDKEIEYLKSYIDLQRLRFAENDNINIIFDIHGDTKKVKIPPFLFIVFIENSFKHGVNYKRPSFINIQFEIVGDVIKFSITNSVHYNKETQQQGLGLKNIKERLELLFRNNHTLEIINANNTFNVYLEIKLTFD